LPIIAAASVLALTAAGGGAYMSLRGKQAPTTPVQTADDLAVNPTVTATPEVADASLDDVLFEEAIVTAETTTDIAAPSATLNALKPIEETATPKTALPTIPKALTLERAAAEGNAVAQYQYGEQRLAAKDYQRGPQMIQQAANQGLPAAQYRLAKLHEEGLGVPRDLTAARAWTQKAAEGGNIKAMHDLAVFYADGEGGPQSYAGSAKWFRQAADFGLVDSQYNLAILHEEGLGVSPSATEALFWYEVALRNGDAGAKAEIDRVRTMVPLDTAQAVAQRAESWVRATPVATANGVFGPSAWGTGSREQVKAVQTVLNGLGYEAGTPDGVAGAGTRTAIRAFQADNGMATTGEITDDLVDRLNQEV
jgi:localization factor PodJL